MRSTAACACVFVAGAIVTLGARQQTQPPTPQQPPKFTASVDVMPIDVTVIDEHGKPIPDLAAADFAVRIEGSPRRVISAEWIPLAKPKPKPIAATLPEGYSSNESATAGRLVMIAIDESNIAFGRGLNLAKAASAFVDRLNPSDRIAALGLGPGSPMVGFTGDRDKVKEAINRMVGQKSTMSNMSQQFNISLSEALDIGNNDQTAISNVTTRECAQFRPTTLEYRTCRNDVRDLARQTALGVTSSAETTINGLRDALIRLRSIDGPKTLILLSEGFVVDHTMLSIEEIGALAAAAQTSVYALQVDDHFFDSTTGKVPIAPSADRMRVNEGLERLASASRGALFKVVGDPAGIFDRIESELSGYYLLGLEPDPRDRDGKVHVVSVDVQGRGATVRARRQILAAAAPAGPARPAKEQIAAGLSTPLVMPGLPMRVATFSLEGPERGKVQMLIHAEIGAEYTKATRMSIGYVIVDRLGRLVEQQANDLRLVPVVEGLPSALNYLAGASLSPGDYTMKIVASDGDKSGSVEHQIHAALVNAGSVRLSELMIGGPLDNTDMLRPIVGYVINYGSVQAYVEAYGPDSSAVAATYEIATDAEAPALVTVGVPGREGAEERVLFTRVIPVHELPPGKYLLRAKFSKDSKPLKTLMRAFEIPRPAGEAAAAKGMADTTASKELFLPLDDAPIAKPFDLARALEPSTLDPFVRRLGAASKDAFDKGVAFTAAHEYPKAEQSFKAAITPDGETTAPLSYLAVTFAAAGHDAEAAHAWQTALVDGSDVPQIYQWLADALVRDRDLASAREILEEAAAKWPSDGRFTRPLALLYATFGRGREAVRTLEQYLRGDGKHDAEALALGVEWICKIDGTGGAVHSRSEDYTLALSYADAYAAAKGPKGALVKQWLYAIEQSRK